jgi:subtilisin
MSDMEYIILPFKGFKSPEMKSLVPQRKGRSPQTSGTSPYSVPVSEGGLSVNVIYSISEDGPKAVSMSTSDAQELRQNGRYRIVPVRKYWPARRPLTAISLKALTDLFSSSSGRRQIRIFIKEEGTDSGLHNVDVIAIVDPSSNAGIRRKTGKTGQTTLTFPEEQTIRQLYVYPPPGYWGKYLESPNLSEGDSIFLSKIDENHQDHLRQVYGSPRIGSGAGVRVAVIDTGVDRFHPDLKVKVARNHVYTESPDDLDPSDGHGTHVAGIIASRKYGLAPKVELCSYKVFPHSGSSLNVYIADAIDQAVKDKCDLINLSLSTSLPDEAICEAIGYAFEHGSVCIVAAGNAKRGQVTASQKRPVSYPAWFKRSLAVSAIGKIGCFPADSVEAGEVSHERSSLDQNVYFASFSNYGREIDLCAPGVGIISTWIGGGYAVENGTSMACPIVTGIAAALLSGDSELLSENRNILRSLKIVQQVQACCQSAGFDNIYEGFGLPRLQ